MLRLGESNGDDTTDRLKQTWALIHRVVITVVYELDWKITHQDIPQRNIEALYLYPIFHQVALTCYLLTGCWAM